MYSTVQKFPYNMHGFLFAINILQAWALVFGWYSLGTFEESKWATSYASGLKLFWRQIRLGR